MYRCPTCIAALPDPTSRRCPMCAQHLRRRRPRVLGEEHRIGARVLPIDRALVDRLRERTASLAPVPATAAAPGSSGGAAPEVTDPPAAEPDPIDVAAYLAAFDVPRNAGSGSADTAGPARPAIPPPVETVVPVEELDPEIKALVDELYERARAEILGTRATTGTTGTEEPNGSGDARSPAPRRRWVPVDAPEQRRGDGPRDGTPRHDR